MSLGFVEVLMEALDYVTPPRGLMGYLYRYGVPDGRDRFVSACRKVIRHLNSAVV